MMSQPEEHTIVMHVMSDISRSKCNQTIKFVQLIECIMRNIFSKKLHTKCSRETSPELFL